jgi:heat shock protein HslJ
VVADDGLRLHLMRTPRALAWAVAGEEFAMKRLLPLALPLLLAACPDSGSNAPAADTAPAPASTIASPAPTAMPAASDANAELDRYHWRLQDATDASGKRIDALFVREDKPLQLDFAKGRIGVANACNRMGGGYSLEGESLTVARLASTMMACSDPKLMALDGEIGKRIEGASKLVFTPGDPPTLALANAAGDTLVFAGEPTADARYGGPGATVYLEIAAHTKLCNGATHPPTQCLQVREVKYDDNGLKVGTPGAFENFYDDIEGYTHEDGVRNVLRVMRYTLANPPADGSRYAYVLDKTIEYDASGKE